MRMESFWTESFWTKVIETKYENIIAGAVSLDYCDKCAAGKYSSLVLGLVGFSGTASACLEQKIYEENRILTQARSARSKRYVRKYNKGDKFNGEKIKILYHYLPLREEMFKDGAVAKKQD